MLITAYPDIVRREGLAAEVVGGFASRSHGPFRRSPPAIVWHHDASPAGPSPGVLGWMIDNWDIASANAWVDYNGKWWFVGAGVAWHAGAVLPGMPGNFEAMGIETDYTVGETISWNLYDSLRRGTAAILRANGQPSSDLHFHKTICSPPGRKSDPWALDLATERTAVAKLIGGGRPSLPLPDPSTPGGPGGADPKDWWDEMSDVEKAQLLADVAEIKARLRGSDPNVDSLQALSMGLTAANRGITSIGTLVGEALGPVKDSSGNSWPFRQAIASMADRIYQLANPTPKD